MRHQVTIRSCLPPLVKQRDSILTYSVGSNPFFFLSSYLYNKREQDFQRIQDIIIETKFQEQFSYIKNLKKKIFSVFMLAQVEQVTKTEFLLTISMRYHADQ